MKPPPKPTKSFSNLDSTQQGVFLCLLKPYVGLLKEMGFPVMIAGGDENTEAVLVELIESGFLRLQITQINKDDLSSQLLIWTGERYIPVGNPNFKP